MTATPDQVEAAATAQFIGGAIASLKPFPLWETLGEKPRELEAAVTWPARTDSPLYSGQGDDRRQSNFGDVTDVPLQAVAWVLLDGMWFPVVAGSFDFRQGREWSTREGNSMGCRPARLWGYQSKGDAGMVTGIAMESWSGGFQVGGAVGSFLRQLPSRWQA